MAPLEKAIMIPGLVIVTSIFWLWIPLFLIIWCIRRAAGVKNTDHENRITHEGYQPPPGAVYKPWENRNRFFPTPDKAGKQQSRKANEKAESHDEHGVSSPEVQRRREEEMSAAQAAFVAQEKRERRERRERIKAEVRKGKEREAMVAPRSELDGQLTKPVSAKLQDGQRHRQ